MFVIYIYLIVSIQIYLDGQTIRFRSFPFFGSTNTFHKDVNLRKYSLLKIQVLVIIFINNVFSNFDFIIYKL